MKIFTSLVLVFMFATSALAETKFTGHCAKAAVSAAVAKWADVPNPDPNLEYMPVSAAPKANNPHVYEVVLGFSDGNEATYGKYDVTFANAAQCQGAVAVEAKQ